MLTCSSPWLFAAYRVLRRLETPRHPPYALCSLTCLATRYIFAPIFVALWFVCQRDFHHVSGTNRIAPRYPRNSSVLKVILYSWFFKIMYGVYAFYNPKMFVQTILFTLFLVFSMILIHFRLLCSFQCTSLFKSLVLYFVAQFDCSST